MHRGLSRGARCASELEGQPRLCRTSLRSEPDSRSRIQRLLTCLASRRPCATRRGGDPRAVQYVRQMSAFRAPRWCTERRDRTTPRLAQRHAHIGASGALHWPGVAVQIDRYGASAGTGTLLGFGTRGERCRRHCSNEVTDSVRAAGSRGQAQVAGSRMGRVSGDFALVDVCVCVGVRRGLRMVVGQAASRVRKPHRATTVTPNA